MYEVILEPNCKVVGFVMDNVVVDPVGSCLTSRDKNHEAKSRTIAYHK